VGEYRTKVNVWDTVTRRRMKKISPEVQKCASIFFTEKNS